jgi:succinate dehydrogenase/fumarate reductase flavoprotein subunit
VPGLYAAGDAATRELICGGFTGGGSHNAAWAMSSGYWAGHGAAQHARALGAHATQRVGKGAGRAGLVSSRDGLLDGDAVVRGVQAEVFPYDRNLFRTRVGMEQSLERLDGLWSEVQTRPLQSARAVLRGREAAAMVATARWAYRTALQRTETRGMHKHMDFPALDPAQQRRLIAGGLDHVWVRPETSAPSQAGVATSVSASAVSASA